MTTAPPPARRRRLQRDKDFTGDRLSSFREVFLRHGLPGLALALLFLASPDLRAAFGASLARGATHPAIYLAVFALLFSLILTHSWRIDRQWDAAKLGWIAYLGALSFWEEWVFRLALPQVLEGWGASVWLAAGLSAALFGAAHYFTLRWKWKWCVGAAVFSLFLSRQMELQGDLLLITAFHWIGTYLNTPRPPGPSASVVA